MAVPASLSLPQFLNSPAFQSWKIRVRAQHCGYRIGKEVEGINDDFFECSDGRYSVMRQIPGWDATRSPFMYSVRLRDIEDLTQGLSIRMAGPADTPYEGGVFELKLTIGNNYPMGPPRLHFVTPVYHPNIDMHTGRINADVLDLYWSPAIRLRTLIVMVQGLLSTPQPCEECWDWEQNAAMLEATRAYNATPQQWATTARAWTVRHACAPRPAWSMSTHARAPAPLRQHVRFLLMIQHRISRAHQLGGLLRDIWLERVMPMALLPEKSTGIAEVLTEDELELFREAAKPAMDAALARRGPN